MLNQLDRKLSEVIGIPVDIGNVSDIAQQLCSRATNPNLPGGYVCVANVHMLTVARQNPKFKSVLENATLTISDGMPLVWTQKIKGHQDAERVCGPDLMLELCRLARDKNQSIYLLGGSPDTLTLLSRTLLVQFPGLKLAGTHSPNQLPDEPNLDKDLIKQINNSGAKFLFVGLGCPKQEFWCATHAPYLNPISIGVGAAFDFHAGTKKRPPSIIQQWGFEWLYRLISEPGRLWKRYLVSNMLFICYSLMDFFSRKKSNSIIH